MKIQSSRQRNILFWSLSFTNTITPRVLASVDNLYDVHLRAINCKALNLIFLISKLVNRDSKANFHAKSLLLISWRRLIYPTLNPRFKTAPPASSLWYRPLNKDFQRISAIATQYVLASFHPSICAPTLSQPASWNLTPRSLRLPVSFHACSIWETYSVLLSFYSKI